MKVSGSNPGSSGYRRHRLPETIPGVSTPSPSQSPLSTTVPPVADGPDAWVAPAAGTRFGGTATSTVELKSARIQRTRGPLRPLCRGVARRPRLVSHPGRMVTQSYLRATGRRAWRTHTTTRIACPP